MRRPPPSTDDDGDGLNNAIDRFALDAANGTQTVLTAGETLTWAFSQNITPPGPSGSLFNLGFTGVMADLLTPYTGLLRNDRIIAGGAAAGVLVQSVAEGSAHGTRNTQLDALQFGVMPGDDVHRFRIDTVVDNPFDAIPAPANYQNFGIYIGTGDQDHYLKLVAGHNNGPSFEVLTENMPSIVSQRYGAGIYGPNVGLTPLDTISLSMEVDVDLGRVTPSWSWTVGRTQTSAGQTFSNTGQVVQLSGDLLQAVRGDYTVTPPVPGGDAAPLPSALAIGLIGTSAGVATPFDTSWRSVRVMSLDAPPPPPPPPPPPRRRHRRRTTRTATASAMASTASRSTRPTASRARLPAVTALR